MSSREQSRISLNLHSEVRAAARIPQRGEAGLKGDGVKVSEGVGDAGLPHEMVETPPSADRCGKPISAGCYAYWKERKGCYKNLCNRHVCDKNP